MGGVLLRFGPAVIALVFIFISYTSWTYSDPPTWTIFQPRTETVVVDTEVRQQRVNGNTRHIPVVVVRWPPGSDGTAELGALTPGFFHYGMGSAEAVVGRYPVNTVVDVRVWQDQPYASDAGWFGPLHAGVISLFTAMLCGIAWVFFIAMGPARRR
ncbi:hypothetical protein [Devosia sp.]|uniref:hypothetical protein n=1 Tax=Devosia sp. TaxID=1871048 RepID=UPI003A92F764